MASACWQSTERLTEVLAVEARARLVRDARVLDTQYGNSSINADICILVLNKDYITTPTLEPHLG